jgi:hypothetical protein
MKQTAVEWLASEINSRGPKENNPPQWLQELYQQAKAMEKEQIKDAANWGALYSDSNKSAEQYYKENYETI